MTGNNTTPGEKLRALFLASLMVLSVMAGTMAFSGTVAAAGNASWTANPTTPNTDADLTAGTTVGSDYAGSSIQTVRLDFTPASDFDGNFANVSDADVDILKNGASAGTATVDSTSNGASTITVSLGSQTPVANGDRIEVVISGSAFYNPSEGDYSGLIHLNPSSSQGKAYAGLTIGTPTGGAAADGFVKETPDDATSPSVDTFDNVGDDVEVAVDYSSFNNQTLSVQHYASGDLVETVTLTDGDNDNVASATLSAAKDGTVEFYNGSERFETKGYTAQNYSVQIINNATYATTDSVQIDGEIYRYYEGPDSSNNLLEDTRNVDYAIYEPDAKTAGNQIVTGDTSNGQFTEVRTFSATTDATSPPPSRTEDFDYPADGSTTPSYEVFVKSDIDNNNAPTPDENTNDGSAIIPVKLNFDLTGPTDVNYGETRDVTGVLTNGDDDGVANYLVEVRNGSSTDANIGLGKTRDTTTAADGEFGFTMEFNDAGIWTYGTNVGNKSAAAPADDSIKYGDFEVVGQEASVTLNTDGDINRANFSHSYNVQVNDTDGTALEVNDNVPESSGYVNVTGPFDAGSVTITTGTLRAGPVDSDGDASDVEYFHAYTNAQGQVEFDATPAGDIGSDVNAELENDDNANPFDGTFDGLENTQDAGDTPQFPDYVGSAALDVVAPDDINVVEFKIQDPRTANSEDFATNTTNPAGDTITNYTNAINLLGPTDGGPDGLIEVLPLTVNQNDRVVNGFRLGNDTFQDFDGMTAYRLKVELRDRANNVVYPGTNDGNVSEIRLEGAGVDGTVNGVNPGNLQLGSSSQNLLAGPVFDGQDHYVVFRPTNADEVDETITVEVNVTGTGSDTDITQEINVSGLYVDEFEVDGEEVDSVEPNTNVNVTAVVRDMQEGDAPINNGRVRVSQNSTALGQIDARTANVNDGQYSFSGLPVGPRGVDTDNDGLADETSQLVFTAYQYEDANNNQALEQDEVDEATVETLGLDIEQDLNVTFLPDSNDTSAYVESKFGGQMVLTKGVEYDSIAFQLTDGEGNAVNLTDGMSGQKVNLNAPVFTNDGIAGDNTNFVNLTALDADNNVVEVGQIYFNTTASRPGDGYYVIEDISNLNGGNTPVSDGDGFLNTGTGAGDGVFSFYDYGATDEGPQQFWLRITTPDLSEQTAPVTPSPFEQSEGEFQVGNPILNTTVVGVSSPGINGNNWGDLAHDGTDNFTDVSDVETMTIGINRTYRVNATYRTFDGTRVNGSAFDRAWIQYEGPLAADGADTSFAAVSTIGNSPATIGGNPTVDLGNGLGEFQFDITVNSSGGDGTFTPKFTLNATHNPDYGVTGVYGNNGDTSYSPNASITGTPTAQNPIVEVYDQSGSSLPNSTETGNDILANDVRQTLRVEAFPADGDDEPLRAGLQYGFRNTDPISQNIVGTTTNTANASELVTDDVLGDEYNEGQLGFLTLTPTGTGDGILALINDNDGTGTIVQDTEADNIVFDVNRANLQLDIDLSSDTLVQGENLTVTLTEDASGDAIPRAGVSLVSPSGNVVEEVTTNSTGVAVFGLPNGAVNGNYTVEARPAGYQPNDATVEVVPPASVTFSDQTTAGETVTVDSAFLRSGGFVVIHNESLTSEGDAIGSVIGVSEYLAPGEHSDIEITLDEPISENQTLIAMPHFDSDGDEVYDFVTSGGTADGPYTIGGSAVIDPAQITVEDDNPTLPNAQGPAQDTDGDGQLEDVDGSGSTDIFDAIALYNNRNTPAVQNNIDAFDFDGSGSVDLFDAIELYNEINA